jgi:hypothetical protein
METVGNKADIRKKSIYWPRRHGNDEHEFISNLVSPAALNIPPLYLIRNILLKMVSLGKANNGSVYQRHQRKKAFAFGLKIYV